MFFAFSAKITYTNSKYIFRISAMYIRYLKYIRYLMYPTSLTSFRSLRSLRSLTSPYASYNIYMYICIYVYIYIYTYIYTCTSPNQTSSSRFFVCVHYSFVFDKWSFHIQKTQNLSLHDVTQSYLRRDSFPRVIWLIHTWDVTGSFVKNTYVFSHIWDMTHSSVWTHTCIFNTTHMKHDWFVRDVLYFSRHIWDVTHSSVWPHSCFIDTTHMKYDWFVRDSFIVRGVLLSPPIFQAWRIALYNPTHAYLTCCMTHVYLRRDSFLRLVHWYFEESHGT